MNLQVWVRSRANSMAAPFPSTAGAAWAGASPGRCRSDSQMWRRGKFDKMHLPMSSPESSKIPLRCTHCGREVAETIHTRSSYRVDYYLLHTGEVQPTTIARPDDPSGTVTILKLLRVSTVVTCADCYRQPDVRQERELLFRPELAAPTRHQHEGPTAH